RQFLPAPHVIEEAPDAPVVEPFGETAGSRFTAYVARSGLQPRRAVLRQLVQRVRPVAPVDEIEIRVAGMIGDGAPVLRVLHSVDDGAVAAGRFTEAAAVLAVRQRAE